jgi:sugar phosphate isomerase/epimerase
MRLAISTLACPDWGLPQVVDACAAAGVHGVDFRGLGAEIDVTRLREFSLDLAPTLDAFRRADLAIPCFATSVTLISPTGQRWQEMLDEAHRYAQLARRTGTRYLRVFGGALPKGMTRDEGLAMASRHLRQIVKMCRTHDTQPVVETHDDWSTSAALRELLHEFDPAEAAALWDVEHTTRAGEPPADTVAGLGRFLKHVHLKDAIVEAGHPTPKLLGEGDVPLVEALHALRATNYTGWLCLETEKRWHPAIAPAPEVSIPQFTKFVARHWSAGPQVTARSA